MVMMKPSRETTAMQADATVSGSAEGVESTEAAGGSVGSGAEVSRTRPASMVVPSARVRIRLPLASIFAPLMPLDAAPSLPSAPVSPLSPFAPVAPVAPQPQAETAFCPFCGQAHSAADTACPHCGKPLA